MPFISTKTTKAIEASKKDTLNSELGRITRECLNKTENWVMTGYEDNAVLYFQGNQNGDTAYVEVKLCGNAPSCAYTKMTSEICALFEKELAIAPDRIYVTYYPTPDWGWNGTNF